MTSTSHRGLRNHERRLQFLNDLAVMLDCYEGLPELPDGRRPDVLRFGRRTRILFLGDAKDTESPGTTNTQARLLRYLSWLTAHLRAGGDEAVFALCYGRAADTAGWRRAVTHLAHEAEFTFYTCGHEAFETNLHVIWFRAKREGLAC